MSYFKLLASMIMRVPVGWLPGNWQYTGGMLLCVYMLTIGRCRRAGWSAGCLGVCRCRVWHVYLICLPPGMLWEAMFMGVCCDVQLLT